MAVEGDRTSNTAVGCITSPSSELAPHSTAASGYRTRVLVTTFNSDPSASNGAPTRFTNAVMRRVWMRECVKFPPAMPIGWIPSNSYRSSCWRSHTRNSSKVSGFSDALMAFGSR